MRPNRIVPLVILALVAGAAPALAAGTTVRVSVGASGQQGNSVSFSPSLSGDGRYVAFQSVASNLVANDSNGAGLDVFVRDRQAGTTTLASVRVGDTSGDREADVDGTFISRSGRYVVFGSNATDLVPNDTNGDYDVFVRDLVARTTRLVSVGSAGQQSDSFSYPMAISATGQFVVFASSATNLVAGVPDTILLYVRDLKTGKTTLESRRPDGRPSAGLAYGGASITPDGHYLAFAFEGSDLVDGPPALGHEHLPPRPVDRPDGAGERRPRRDAGQRPELRPVHLRQRPAGRVRLVRLEPRPERHQLPGRRVRA